MRWPWVSRERFEASERETRRWMDGWVTSQHREGETRRMYDALLEKYHALASPPVVPSVVRAEGNGEKKPSIIGATIREEAAGDVRLATYLRKRSRELKKENPKMSDEEIAEQLASWQSTENEGRD